MPAKKPKSGHAALTNASAIFHDEDAARAHFEALLWPAGPVCPHCSATEPYTLTAKPGSKKPVRKGVYKCRKCRKQFTVRVGTIFESSKMPLHKWAHAIFLMTGSKKGVSSHQLARTLDITVKSAWFLSHRVREAMRMEPLAGMLSGTVEIDEAYVGGKPRKPMRNKNHYPTGRGTKKKPVAALVERDGNAVCFPIEHADAATLKGAARAVCHPSSTIMTDEWRAYSGLDREFAAHHVVRHGKLQYVRRIGEVKASTNEAESFFAILKRSHYGIHHHLSKKHLHRYCTERAFMWNGRKKADGERMADAIAGAKGRRLRFREPA